MLCSAPVLTNGRYAHIIMKCGGSAPALTHFRRLFTPWTVWRTIKGASAPADSAAKPTMLSINKKDETLNARIEAFEHIIIELKKEIDLLQKQQEIKELRELEPISHGDLEMLKFMSEAFNQKKIWKEKMNIE